MAIIKLANLKLTGSGYSVNVIAEGFETIGAITLKLPHSNQIKVVKVLPMVKPLKNGNLVWKDNADALHLNWIYNPTGKEEQDKKNSAKDGKLFKIYFHVITNPLSFGPQCEIADNKATVVSTKFVMA